MASSVLSIAAFKVQYPSLSLSGSADDDAFIQAWLDHAKEQLNASVWGSKLSLGHGLLTAHLIAISPFGETAKLSKGGESTWGKQYMKLRNTVASGYRVATKVAPLHISSAGVLVEP